MMTSLSLPVSTLTFLLLLTCVASSRLPNPFRSVDMGSPLHDVMTGKSRQTRNAHDLHAPCLSVPYLTLVKNRFHSLLDANDDGRATFPEVKAFLQRFKPTLKDETVTAFIGRRDENDNGLIEFLPEYVNSFVLPDYTPEAAAEWFNLHDTDSNGLVTEKELITAGKAIGLSPESAEQEVKGYYMPMDRDNDGQLNYDEFKVLYEPPPEMPFPN